MLHFVRSWSRRLQRRIRVPDLPAQKTAPTGGDRRGRLEYGSGWAGIVLPAIRPGTRRCAGQNLSYVSRRVPGHATVTRRPRGNRTRSHDSAPWQLFLLGIGCFRRAAWASAAPRSRMSRAARPHLASAGAARSEPLLATPFAGLDADNESVFKDALRFVMDCRRFAVIAALDELAVSGDGPVIRNGDAFDRHIAGS